MPTRRSRRKRTRKSGGNSQKKQRELANIRRLQEQRERERKRKLEEKRRNIRKIQNEVKESQLRRASNDIAELKNKLSLNESKLSELQRHPKTPRNRDAFNAKIFNQKRLIQQQRKDLERLETKYSLLAKEAFPAIPISAPRGGRRKTSKKKRSSHKKRVKA